MLYITTPWLIYGLSLREFRAWFGLPAWWIRIVENPEALASFLGTAIGGFFVAVAAGIGFYGIRWRTISDERRKRRSEKRERANALHLLAAELRYAAGNARIHGRRIARHSDRELSTYEFTAGGLQQIADYGDIVHEYRAGLSDLPSDLLDQLIECHRTRVAVCHDCQAVENEPEGPDRTEFLHVLARNLVYSYHHTQYVAAQLDAFRSGKPLEKTKDLKALKAAAEDDIATARADALAAKPW